MLNHQYYSNQYPQQFPPNIISGQILQANGADSVKSIKMNANSSCLVADSQLPIVYKCVSDGLCNVSVQAFDISPHKSEEEVMAESMENRLSALERHLSKIENMLHQEPVYSA